MVVTMYRQHRKLYGEMHHKNEAWLPLHCVYSHLLNVTLHMICGHQYKKYKSWISLSSFTKLVTWVCPTDEKKWERVNCTEVMIKEFQRLRAVFSSSCIFFHCACRIHIYTKSSVFIHLILGIASSDTCWTYSLFGWSTLIPEFSCVI